MRSPIDAMLDHVDWTCVVCGTSMKIGCDCYEKTKAAAIERDYQELMKLSDANLLAECERLGVKLDK